MTTLNKATIANQDILNTRYELKGNNTHGQYIFANTDVSYDLIVGDTKILILYQNGHSYDYGDYQCPSNDFELYDEGVLGRIYRNSGEFNDDDLNEAISDLSDIGLKDFNADDILALYELLVNECPSLESLSIDTDFDNFIYTVDVGDSRFEDKEWSDVEPLDCVVDVNPA